ncbi:hypothetical protein ACQJBY_000172 [Aegilops geniculata]
MRPQVLLVAFAVLAALPLAHSQVANPWPSCDNCDSCTKSNPPGCTRWNYLSSWVFYRRPSTRAVSCPPSGHDSFQCTNRINDFCEGCCTPAAKSFSSLCIWIDVEKKSALQ